MEKKLEKLPNLCVFSFSESENCVFGFVAKLWSTLLKSYKFSQHLCYNSYKSDFLWCQFLCFLSLPMYNEVQWFKPLCMKPELCPHEYGQNLGLKKCFWILQFSTYIQKAKRVFRICFYGFKNCGKVRKSYASKVCK